MVKANDILTLLDSLPRILLGESLGYYWTCIYSMKTAPLRDQILPQQGNFQNDKIDVKEASLILYYLLIFKNLIDERVCTETTQNLFFL